MLDQTEIPQEMAQKPHKRNVRLRQLIQSEKLKRQEAAEIMDATKSAVDQWLRDRESPNYREMPDRYLRLLEFELGLRSPQHTRFHRGTK